MDDPLDARGFRDKLEVECQTLNQGPQPELTEKNSHNRGVLESTLEDIPFARAVASFFIREGKAVKSGWLAMIIVAGIALWFGRGWGEQRVADLISDKQELTRKVDILNRANDNLTRDNQLYSQRNTDLQVTVAPLLERAVKEFPMDNINTSLKKIIEQLEKQDPLAQLITSANATVFLTVQSNHPPIVGSYLTGTCVSFGDNVSPAPLLSASTTVHQESGKGMFSAKCDCDIGASTLFERPIRSLLAARRIDVAVEIPAGTEVSSGKVVWIINNQITLTFDIPEQKADVIPDGRVYVHIMDIHDGLGNLAKQP